MWGNPTLLNLLKKYWEKVINCCLRKVNTDIINCEELYDGTAEPQIMQLPWLVNFKFG